MPASTRGLSYRHRLYGERPSKVCKVNKGRRGKSTRIYPCYSYTRTRIQTPKRRVAVIKMIPDTASDTRHPLSFSLGSRGRDWAARGVVFRRGDYSTEEQSDCSRPTSCCVSTLLDILKHALVICQPLADIIISLTV